MANSYNYGGGGSEYDQQDEQYSAVPLAKPYALPANSRYKQVDPSKPLNQSQAFVDKQTGQTITGMLTPGSDTIYQSSSNPNKTQQAFTYNTTTGQKVDQDPHNVRDMLKNAAMILGPVEGLGVAAGMGAFGGASGGASSGVAPQIAQTAEGVSGLGLPAATTSAVPAFGTTAASLSAPSALSGTAASLAAAPAASTLTGGGIGSEVAATSGAFPIAGAGAGMNPLLMQSLIGLGGNFLSGLNQGHMNDQQLAQALKIAQMNNTTQNQALAQSGTQLNPYSQLQAGQKQALAQLLANHSSPSTYTPGTTSEGNNPHMLTAGSYGGGASDILAHLSEYLAPYQSMFTPQAAGTANADFQKTLSKNPQYQTPHSPWADVLGSNTSDPVQGPMPTSQDYTPDPSKGGISNAGGFSKLIQDYLNKKNQFPQ